MKHAYLMALALVIFAPAAVAEEEAVSTGYISQEEALAEVKAKAKETPTSEMDEDEVEKLNRLKLIDEAGRNYGVQLGRYNRWLAQVDLLNKQAITLDQGFPFARLYLRGGTLQPPILDSADDYRAIEDEGKLRRLVKTSYRTLVQARFRNNPLSWRDFLLPDDLAPPPLPREALLPRNGEEEARWSKAMKEGWEEGRLMAIDEGDLRLEALQRGYRGMILYRLMALHGMIDPPKVIERKPGEVITSDSGDEMLVGVQEEIISQDAYFVSEPGRWKPVDYGFVEPGNK